MKIKNIITIVLAFVMGITFVLPAVAQTDNTDMETIMEQFKNNPDASLIPEDASNADLIKFLNMAIIKRKLPVVEDILAKGVDLQGSDDPSYQDPLLVVLLLDEVRSRGSFGSLGIDEEIMKLLVDHGLDMTMPYITPDQTYDSKQIKDFFKGTVKGYEINENDRFNVFSVALAILNKDYDNYFSTKFQYLLQLGKDKSVVNKIDMKNFAQSAHTYRLQIAIDTLLKNNMIVKEEHIKIVKRIMITKEQDAFPLFRASGMGVIFDEPMSSGELERYRNTTVVGRGFTSISKEKKRTKAIALVRKYEELLHKLEKQRAEQQEEFTKNLDEAITQINLDKLSI